jgi:outer membrane protein assembly factor BamB
LEIYTPNDGEQAWVSKLEENMKPWLVLSILSLLFTALAVNAPSKKEAWTQWGANPQHTGSIPVSGQSLQKKLAAFRYDPFVKQETKDFAGLGVPAHFQVPLIEGNDVFMEFKTGKWIPCHPPLAWENGKHCGPNTWYTEIWNEKRLVWRQGKLVETWTFTSDWKPEPNGFPTGLSAFEPVFHPALTKSFLYVPGSGGTIWKVDKGNGKPVSHINPFGSTVDVHKYVSGPLTADPKGNIYFNVLKLANASDPWYTHDVQGAWLVKVATDDTTATVTYHTLVPHAPPPKGNCPGTFFDPKTLPWPPSRTAKPVPVPCGSQRPGVNVAPAIAPDGTIYTVSRAHHDPLAGYLVAVNPDLSAKWQASMQQRFHDGCGVIVPIATHKRQPNACREGAKKGVDPNTNEFGTAQVLDYTSAGPVVLPDGNVLIAGGNSYGQGGGHLMKFTPAGEYLTAYPYGYDLTAAVYPHDSTYSMVLKENHYPVGLYCYFPNNIYCKPLVPVYYITQLNGDLKVEWKFKDPTVDRKHPHGFEWCVNEAAIDGQGNVYVNSEDGNLYELDHAGKLASKLFLQLAIGAAYTPSSIGPDGTIYTQNDGVMFAIGQ